MPWGFGVRRPCACAVPATASLFGRLALHVVHVTKSRGTPDLIQNEPERA